MNLFVWAFIIINKWSTMLYATHFYYNLMFIIVCTHECVTCTKNLISLQKKNPHQTTHWNRIRLTYLQHSIVTLSKCIQKASQGMTRFCFMWMQIESLIFCFTPVLNIFQWKIRLKMFRSGNLNVKKNQQWNRS